MKHKPTIKLKRRSPVFTARQWRCSGFDAGGQRYGLGYGWTPQEAYYNWQNDLTVNY